MKDKIKDFFVYHCETIITILFGIFSVGIVIISFCLVFFTHPKTHTHVHFFDTNECYNVKRSWFEKGVAFITFDDGSFIKCSANNVIVYVDRVCDYCGE